MDNAPTLSVFGESRIGEGRVLLQMQKNMSNAYGEHNTNGIVNLAVAENTLMNEDLRQYFEANLHLKPVDFTYGDGLGGSTRLRQALSALFNSHFNPKIPVLPDHLLAGAGVMPLLSHLARAIANPGDGILIAEPYYQGFEISIAIEHGIKPVGVPVPFGDLFTLKEVDHLEKRYEESKEAGTLIKAVILCNPHNPYGRCYPVEVLEAYCRFCEKHNLHLISDEIFALSVFPSNDVPEPQPFISILSLDLKSMDVNPSRIHILYGMSKDFNANGFRAAVLVSQSNLTLLTSLTVTSIFMIIASPTDALWTTMLRDEVFLPTFLGTNRRLLRESYEYTISWLRFHEIPYIPASAAHFLMVDFRPVLSDITSYGSLLSISDDQNFQDRERKLVMYLISNGVVMTPGTSCHMAEGGWFRLSFAIRRDYANVGLTRIETALGWERWPGISSS